MPESLVLLHGFSGTRRAWDGVIAALDRERYSPLALDLPGHGEQGRVRPIDFAGCVAEVLARAPERFELCGYSLGGRIALHVALVAPERVTRLVLISTGAGIEDAGERSRRRQADEQLARELEAQPLERFIERWRTQPLFAHDPPEVDRLAREDQRRNNAENLAAVLRGIGTGQMRALWDDLPRLSMPATVIVGERDGKYVEIGRRMARLLRDGELVVLPAGHNVALESPLGVARALTTGRRPRRSPTAS